MSLKAGIVMSVLDSLYELGFGIALLVATVLPDFPMTLSPNAFLGTSAGLVALEAATIIGIMFYRTFVVVKTNPGHTGEETFARKLYSYPAKYFSTHFSNCLLSNLFGLVMIIIYQNQRGAITPTFSTANTDHDNISFILYHILVAFQMAMCVRNVCAHMCALHEKDLAVMTKTMVATGKAGGVLYSQRFRPGMSPV